VRDAVVGSGNNEGILMSDARRRAFWFRIAFGSAALIVAFGVALLLVSITLWNVRVDNASRAAAVLQASAAAASLLGTGALVGITTFYASTTAEMLRRTTPEITVELKRAWTDGIGVVTAPVGTPEEFGTSRGYADSILAVVVRNAGGAPATVDSVAIDLPGGFGYSVVKPSMGPSWPHRLESQSSVTFLIDASASAVTQIAEIANVERKIRATCFLGSGETRHSAWMPFAAR
jgi:hypothetical protein